MNANAKAIDAIENFNTVAVREPSQTVIRKGGRFPMTGATCRTILASDASVDLQLHTTNSDGSWTPEHLMDHAVSKGFDLIAITDHDRVDTAAALQQLAWKKGIALLSGVEMTCTWHGGLVDILCFGFYPAHNALASLAEDLLGRQRQNTRDVYWALVHQGRISEKEDALAAILELPAPRQPHGLAAMLRQGSFAEAEGRILAEAGCSLVTNEIAKVVEAARQSGAIAIIAHPGRGRGFVLFTLALLDRIRQEVPVDGIETDSPHHTRAQVAAYRHYAETHRLLKSTGSDSHGPDRKPIRFEARLSRALLERVEIEIR